MSLTAATWTEPVTTGATTHLLLLTLLPSLDMCSGKLRYLHFPGPRAHLGPRYRDRQLTNGHPLGGKSLQIVEKLRILTIFRALMRPIKKDSSGNDDGNNDDDTQSRATLRRCDDDDDDDALSTLFWLKKKSQDRCLAKKFGQFVVYDRFLRF